VNLNLFGIAVSDHGLLDQPGGIFGDRHTASGGNHQHDPASLAKLERRLRVLVDEDFFDGGRIRRDIGNQRLELTREVGEPLRKSSRRVGFHLPVGDVRETVAFSLDQPPAGCAEAGVEAKDLQASFSSSSSGTS